MILHILIFFIFRLIKFNLTEIHLNRAKNHLQFFSSQFVKLNNIYIYFTKQNKMESLALSNVSVLANTVSINAVAATKVAGVRMAKPSRALHTPAMVNIK